MTFDEALKLPNGTKVQLLDGKTGRMSVWHKSAKTVGIEVRGEGLLRELAPERLRRESDGSCTEIEPPMPSVPSTADG